MKNTNFQSKPALIKASALSHKMAKVVAVGAVASVLATSMSHAVLRVTFDLRAVQTGIGAGVSSTGLVGVSQGANGQTAQVAPGASVVLQLVATINSDSAVQDAFLRADGSFITSGTTGFTGGSFRSDLSQTAVGVNNVEPFKGIASRPGLNTADLSTVPDGILDLGSNTQTTSFTNFFTANSTDLTNGALGQSFILGETVLTLQGAGSTIVNFVPRLFTGAGSAGARTSFIFKVDGTQFSYRGDGALASQNGGVGDPTTFVFNPVTLVAVPEPSAFGMVFIGAMGLVGFRRMGLRQK